MTDTFLLHKAINCKKAGFYELLKKYRNRGYSIHASYVNTVWEFAGNWSLRAF